MKRFTLGRAGAFLSSLTIAAMITGVLAAQAAQAAAPNITFQSTTHLTTRGNTALTYTGYMNGESFQQDGLTSYNGWEYTAYWDSSGHVNVSRRPLPSGSWQNVVLTDYTTTSTDSHNVICIGIAHSDGTIHLAFGMHDSTLRYRKSVTGLATAPSSHTWTASDFGATQSQLTGTTLTQLTYPAFINAPGNRLQLALRVGASGSGNEVLYEYNSPSWTYVGEFMTASPGARTHTCSASNTTAAGAST
jgi:BNR repeat-containing family member